MMSLTRLTSALVAISTLSIGLWQPSARAQCFPSEFAQFTGDHDYADDWYAFAVAADGNMALIGAPHDNEQGWLAGAVQAYGLENGVWQQQARLTAEDGQAWDEFGYSLAIDGDVAVIGAPGAELLLISGTRPVILNRIEIAQALEREYPPALRNQGISGTAQVIMLVTESGRVEHAEVSESAGHAALDQAAVRVARGIEFSELHWDGAPICYVTAGPISFITR